MSKTTFTPGPWTANFAHDGGLIVYAWHIAASEHGSIHPICGYSRINAGPRSHEEERANARLIAAAPDLYEALSGLVDATVRDANEHGISGFTGARLTDARAALAKARGDDPQSTDTAQAASE